MQAIRRATAGERADLAAWSGGRLVGFVTSGGYGHTIDQSLAMAMVNTDLCAEGTKLSVHVVGVEQIAEVIAPSPYDQAGAAMRV